MMMSCWFTVPTFVRMTWSSRSMVSFGRLYVAVPATSVIACSSNNHMLIPRFAHSSIIRLSERRALRTS